MQDLLTFLSFNDPNIRAVTLGCVLLGITTSLVGAFAFLRKQTLVGDAVAHAIFPGICLGFLWVGEKKMTVLMVGAFATGWLALLAIRYIKNHSILKNDTIMALILSVFFAIGIVLLSFIQTTGNPHQSGLSLFLFGSAASLVQDDLLLFNGMAVVTLVVLFLFMKEFLLLSFDGEYAKSIGIVTWRFDTLLTVLMVVSIVIGVQTVGLVLISSLLIIPPTIARFWTHRFAWFLFFSIFCGALAAFVGAYISYIAPHMPTGPWIVLVLSAIATLSFFVSPKGGLLAQWLRNKRLKRKIHQEHMLKTLYQLCIEKKQRYYTQEALCNRYYFSGRQFFRITLQLCKRGWISQKSGALGRLWGLTVAGEEVAARVVRRHRLWELYLTRYMHMLPDNVHVGADAIEHILTPEVEAQLQEVLDYPKKDPHNSPIPYSSASSTPKKNP